MLALLDNIDDAFSQVHDLLPSKRREKLLQLYPDNPEIVDEVEMLVRVSKQSPHFLSCSPLVNQFNINDDAAEIPSQLGPFAIRRKLGEGGMGYVYLAERVDGEFEHLVAIKIIKQTLGDQAAEKHFIKERQILANLNNPHIARLFDGGRTPQNRPYFVMEFVQGVSISDYVKNNQLDVQQIISIFIKICEAVQYAHEQGIVHRDLKPNNILINEQACPKLLDFGIAKIANEDNKTSNYTATGKHLMTPDYAAPEMIEGKKITPAADIYALGIILYELLAGVRPYDLTNMSIATLVKTICEKPVTLPPNMEKNKNINKKLEKIVLKALQKKVENRYVSVSELVHDLNNYLHHENNVSRKLLSGLFDKQHLKRFTKIILSLSLILLATLSIGLLTVQSENNKSHVTNSSSIIAERTRSIDIEKIDEKNELSKKSIFTVNSVSNNYPKGKNGQEALFNRQQQSQNLIDQMESHYGLKLLLSKNSNGMPACIYNATKQTKIKNKISKQEKFKCNILKARWFNQKQDPDSALNYLLEAREYFVKNKKRVSHIVKAWMFQVLSETYNQLGEAQQALYLQKNSVKFFRFATNKNIQYAENLINALETLKNRYASMGNYGLVQKIDKEIKRRVKRSHNIKTVDKEVF